jgi:UDP-GlcNAc3NAcA epimerase
MKIVTVIGARPQLIKSAIFSKAINDFNAKTENLEIKEFIIHTGQHYDVNMNDVFFKSLNVRTPYRQFHCGGNRNVVVMLSEMLIGIEQSLTEIGPDFVVVFGDTTSTLAGALAASILHIPVIHIEAGLRSFNRQMQEETNRILTDHIAELLFCPTCQAVKNLANENVTNGVFHSGDVMYDAALMYAKIAFEKSSILNSLNLKPKKFRLCTVHRAENTDNMERLTGIINALAASATDDCPIIFPVHPRTRLCIEKYRLSSVISANKAIQTVNPLDYIDMVMLEMNALTILTDSGGVQKEAYFHHTPCVTLREETEWTETVEAGWNQLAGFKTDNILDCLTRSHLGSDIREYGNGNAAAEMVKEIVRHYILTDNQ